MADDNIENIEKQAFLGKKYFLPKKQAFLGKKLLRLVSGPHWRHDGGWQCLIIQQNRLIFDKNTSPVQKKYKKRAFLGKKYFHRSKTILKNQAFFGKKYFLRSKKYRKMGLFSEKILPPFQKILKKTGLFSEKILPPFQKISKTQAFFGEKSCSI